MSGSTALGERLDPETLRQVMSRYFAAAKARLERQGGTVEKFIGDAVMAVFGVPAVHEDDACARYARSSRCGTRSSASTRSSTVSTAVRIETRTGVNTGEVIVGGPVGADQGWQRATR